MITKFTFKITDYNDDKGFSVIYTPDDPVCTPIAQWVKLPPLDNEEAILDHLTKASPQGEWERQKLETTVDKNIYRNLVGREEAVEVKSPTDGLSINPLDAATIQEVESKVL